MKRGMVLTAVILSLILTSFSVSIGPADSREGAEPAPSDITYINNNITVNDTQVWENKTIVLTGNLTVESGGSLTLKNITLRMNSTDSVEYFIEVLNGGNLHVIDLDYNNYTTNDVSKILRNNETYTYFFRAYEGSTLEIRNSVIQGCGRFSGLLENEGLYIRTDSAVIDHSNFSYSTDGLVLYNSDAVVSNNTFYWNGGSGIYAGYWSNATIENNLILSNREYGIWVDGGSNSNPKGSNPLITNNRILDTGRGTYTAVGIQITTYSCPTIKNNQIIGSTEDGIYAGEWCQAIIINNTIDNMGGNIGIASSAPMDLIITNCTITNTAIYSLSLGQAYFILTNSSFNNSAAKIKFWDYVSNLTVRNYLHIYVNDSAGKPIPNATAHITDNANGTYDKDFTTDENGYVKWIVLTDYWQNSTTTINYSDYKVSVSYPGVSFIDNNRSVRMNLSKTEVFTATTEADTRPPVISNIVPADGSIVSAGEKINVSADVEDHNKTSDIGNVTLHWSIDSWTIDNTVPMWLDNASAYNEGTEEALKYVGGRWYGDIPPQSEGTDVQFYITAADVIGNTANSAGETITAAAPSSTDPFVVYGYVYLYNGSGVSYNPLLCDGAEYNNANVVVSWINASSGLIESLSMTTDNLGRYQADLYNYSDGGTVWVNASDSTNVARYEINSTAINAVNGGAMVNVTFGVPYRLNITNPTNGSTVIRGNAFSVVYSVYDSHGVIAPGYYGTVNLTSNDTLANLPPDYTFAGITDGGQTTVSCTLNTGGIFYINATDTLGDMSHSSLYPANGQWWDQILLNVTTGGFTWDLSVRGWHIVSVPQIPIATNNTASKIVSLIHYTAQRDGVALADITIANRTGSNPSTYDTYIYGSGGVDFHIEIGMAYWVYVNTGFPSSVFIQATNYTSSTFTRTVFNGWNMIGLAHNDSVGVLANGGLVQFADSDGAGQNIGMGPTDGYITYTGTPWYISYWHVGTQKYQTYIYKFNFNNFNDPQNHAINIYAGATGFWIYIYGGGSMGYSVVA